MKAKKFKVEDAMNATKAGVEEGIVAGGGVALLNAAGVLEKLKGADMDEQTGISIVKKALEEPLRQIAENAGLEGSVVVRELKGKKENFGLDVESRKYGDMMELGIVDPVKVTRLAIENAASIASTLLTTEALITDIPEEKPQIPPMPPGGGMY